MESKIIPTKKVGNTNRRKGFNAERFYAQCFRDLGYPFCKTTRESSRLLDSCKIDLNFLPVLVQIKAGKQKNFNPSKILFEMEENLKTNFPPEEAVHSKPKIVIHHKQGVSGKKRNEFDTLVIMSFETFKQFLKNYDRTI